MYFSTNKTPVEIIKEGGTLEELILEIFIHVLIVNGTKTHGKNFMN